MAEIKLIQNGARKVSNPRRKKRTTKRRNTATATRRVTVAAKVANPRKRRRRRRNPVASTTIVRRTASNPRKRKTVRRRRRNGIMSKRNGLFGDSKATAKSIFSLLIGLGLTKVESGVVAPVVARGLATVGLSNFAVPLTQAAFAVTVNHYVAKRVAGQQQADMVRLGGLAMALMSAIEQLLPQASVYNPFAPANILPVVVAQPALADGSGRAITNRAVASAQMSGMRQRGRGYRTAY